MGQILLIYHFYLSYYNETSFHHLQSIIIQIHHKWYNPSDLDSLHPSPESSWSHTPFQMVHKLRLKREATPSILNPPYDRGP